MREKELSVVEIVEADLRLRSDRLFGAEDHGREGRFEEREEEEEEGVNDADLDRKRKQRLNERKLVIAPSISTTRRSI